MHSAPARLQRMLLMLQGYDIVLEHKPGTEIPLADTLSRHFLPDTYPELSEATNNHVNFVMKEIPVSDRKMQEIRLHTKQDPELQLLKSVILNGWPDKHQQCPPELQEYWNYRDELSVIDDIIIKGQRIIIPKALRSNMLEILHSGHFGIDKVTNRARLTMFWPGITSDISKVVQQCEICLEHRCSNPKEPLVSHEVPEYPWQNCATDVFTLDGEDYLLIVDYYSHYFEVEKLSNTKTISVIKKMKCWFSRHGIPMKLVSDNASYYTSAEFQTFTQEWDISHVTISPYMSNSLGMAEKYVGIVKRILKKSKQAGTDPLIAILEYRATPLNIGFSPSQLLMGRNIRSFLPMNTKKLCPKAEPPKNVRSALASNQSKQKSNYDKTATPLKPLNIGETIRFKQGTWKPCVVLDQLNPRSYKIRTPEGSEYVRNRRHLLKTNEPMHPQLPDLTEDDILPPSDINETQLPSPTKPPCTPPNPLDRSASSDMQTQQLEIPSCPHNTNQNASKTNVTTTRYGRVVKPTRRFIDD